MLRRLHPNRSSPRVGANLTKKRFGTPRTQSGEEPVIGDRLLAALDLLDWHRAEKFFFAAAKELTAAKKASEPDDLVGVLVPTIDELLGGVLDGSTANLHGWCEEAVLDVPGFLDDHEELELLHR